MGGECERPVRVSEYALDGKTYTVVAHFIGNNDINGIVDGIAVRRADADAGLNAAVDPLDL